MIAVPSPARPARRLGAVVRRLGRLARHHGAGVVGGLLALGSCGLAACDGEAVEPVDPPAVSTTPAPTEEVAVEDAPPPTEPRLDAEEATLGVLELAPGFMPDPASRAGTTAGGPVDAHLWDDRCDGWIAETPDAIVRIARPIAELGVLVASDEDTTVVVVGPDGEPRCNDDAEGAHPSVRATFDAGVHRVWVGTAERGTRARFVLSLTELEAVRPSETLDQ